MLFVQVSIASLAFKSPVGLAGKKVCLAQVSDDYTSHYQHKVPAAGVILGKLTNIL